MRLTLKLFQKTAAAALCLSAAAFMSGCASERLKDNTPPPPPPTQAAPLGQVSQSDLPPVGGQASAAPMGAPANAADLTPASVAGVWKADLGGMSCQLATPQTQAGKGYRAGAIHCPAAFAQLGSWNINGKQLIFYDKSGNNLATLYSTGANSFTGQTAGGAPVALSR